MKISDVKSAAVDILKNLNSDDYSNFLTETALDNDLCIEISDKYNRVMYYTDALGKSCLIHGPDSVRYSFIQQLKDSNQSIMYFKVYNSKINSNTIVLAAVIGSADDPQGYILINSPLIPVGSTASIMKKQLIIISIALILIGIIISFFMAKRISRPISKITSSAKQLASGNYDVKFEGGSYKEIQELANTLTYAGQEISKVDTLQRDLIANVSHDLRTPLTMLKAYAEMIKDISGDNPIKRNQHLDIIIDETDRLALLVNDILDLSKLEGGGGELNYSEFGIKSLLEDIIDRYKGISKQSDYHINYTPDAEIFVRCDVIKIQQVIYNLINNAINYTGDDKQIFVTHINTPSCVRIEVSDTGQGISDEKIKLIFDKYYRSENHKREVIGTGLGLSIVKAILKMHGYNFGVSSIIGHGSTFWFEISDLAESSPENK